MSLITVAPDKTRMFSHSRLRFWVDVDMPLFRIPDHLRTQTRLAIEKMEQLRGWKLAEVVPAKRLGAETCCEQMDQLPGTPLKITYTESPLQGDTDDLHNQSKSGDPNFRNWEQGKRDVIAHVHFVQPATSLFLEDESHKAPGLNEGFLPTGDLPAPLREDLFTEFNTDSTQDDD